MFHLFTGQVRKQQKSTYLHNQYFGIQVHYLWTAASGEFFLYPYLDDNKKTIIYYAFDTSEQKSLFESLLKVNGIGPKTAFHIVQLPQKELELALQNVDVKFFQAIPGVGPKSAKKILLELKSSIKVDDFDKINIDDKLFKSITSSLKNFGYESSKIKEVLGTYPDPITKNNLSEVIKWVIKKM